MRLVYQWNKQQQEKPIIKLKERKWNIYTQKRGKNWKDGRTVSNHLRKKNSRNDAFWASIFSFFFIFTCYKFSNKIIIKVNENASALSTLFFFLLWLDLYRFKLIWYDRLILTNSIHSKARKGPDWTKTISGNAMNEIKVRQIWNSFHD